MTPGAQEGLKYLTSTPYNNAAANSSPYSLPTSSAPYMHPASVANQYSTPVSSGSNLQPTSSAVGGGVGGYQVQQQFHQLQTVEETSWETPACSNKGESREMQERREENYQV